jgi:flagellar secretion chaperone FliS
MWQDAYLESRILGANPVELIRILYQEALDSTQDARRMLAAGDIPGRCRAITRVTTILSELEASLDHTTGGSISRNLAELYQYMRARLVDASFLKSDAFLAEVQSLLATLAEAWSGVSTLGATPATPAPAPAAWMSAPIEEPAAQLVGQSWSA